MGDTGLAAAYSADRGIASHPSVIFAEDFESTDYQRHWDEARDKSGDVLSLARFGGDKDPFGRSLKVRAVLGRNTGGGLTKWFQSADTLYVRFYTRFDSGCDYVHHFVTLRANKSLREGIGGRVSAARGRSRRETNGSPRPLSPGATGVDGRRRGDRISTVTGMK